MLDFVVVNVQLRLEDPRRIAVETPVQDVGEVGDSIPTQHDEGRSVLGALERPRFQLRQFVVEEVDE